LIAQLGHGAGDQLYASVTARQKAHDTFIDTMGEPSARLGDTDFAKGDATSLHSFAVGAGGHPFHRHAGHRIFTAVSGSGGAQLRFADVTSDQIAHDPRSFLDALHYVTIPPDCMFTVRFGGGIWHQFVPLAEHSRHPVFFALSCHTNELGGELSDTQRAQVLANHASIPALTELLPPGVVELLRESSAGRLHVPTTDLAMEAPPGTLRRLLCKTARCVVGLVRGWWSVRWHGRGFFTESYGRHTVSELAALPEGSLLRDQLADAPLHHEDTFQLTLDGGPFRSMGATALLGRLLDGFLNNPPRRVSQMMALRNVLVKPIGLRTSPLGCPVSSLLSPCRNNLFEQRHPVLVQRINHGDTHAQVILGADDRHLRFRSCVGIRMLDRQRVEITLGTRVHCKNLFGRVYMAMIDRVHRGYVTPTMLRMATEHAFPISVISPARTTHSPVPTLLTSDPGLS
jgi:hypothetical protein